MINLRLLRGALFAFGGRASGRRAASGRHGSGIRSRAGIQHTLWADSAGVHRPGLGLLVDDAEGDVALTALRGIAGHIGRVVLTHLCESNGAQMKTNPTTTTHSTCPTTTPTTTTTTHSTCPTTHTTTPKVRQREHIYGAGAGMRGDVVAGALELRFHHHCDVVHC